jgi:hypothetical protein
VGDACGLGGKLAEPEQKFFQAVVEVLGHCLQSALFADLFFVSYHAFVVCRFCIARESFG